MKVAKESMLLHECFTIDSLLEDSPAMQYRTNKKKMSRGSDDTTNIEVVKRERRKLKKATPNFGIVSSPERSKAGIACAIADINWNR